MKIGFRLLIIIGVFLVVMFLIGQTTALLNYEYVVSIGMQESEQEITNVGIAFAKGFAFGDTMIYIPLFIIGAVGLLKKKSWGIFSMFGAFAITVYWPLVHLYAIYVGRDGLNLSDDKYLSYSIILPLIIIYGLWGMWYLYKNKNSLYGI